MIFFPRGEFSLFSILPRLVYLCYLCIHAPRDYYFARHIRIYIYLVRYAYKYIHTAEKQ